MKMEKYLFLDIDGVLNSERTVFAYDKLIYCALVKHKMVIGEPVHTYFDPIAVLLLKAAQKQIGFKIIISSTWRLSLSLNDFHTMFEEYEWDTTDVIIGKTVNENVCRGQQIKNWLNSNAEPPYQYVILDDSSDMLREQMGNFVKTDLRDGLSFENFKQIFKVFGQDYSDSLGFIIKEKD